MGLKFLVGLLLIVSCSVWVGVVVLIGIEKVFNRVVVSKVFWSYRCLDMNYFLIN